MCVCGGGGDIVCMCLCVCVGYIVSMCGSVFCRGELAGLITLLGISRDAVLSVYCMKFL